MLKMVGTNFRHWDLELLPVEIPCKECSPCTIIISVAKYDEAGL